MNNQVTTALFAFDVCICIAAAKLLEDGLIPRMKLSKQIIIILDA
jgi:hypothetical protein